MNKINNLIRTYHDNFIGLRADVRNQLKVFPGYKTVLHNNQLIKKDFVSKINYMGYKNLPIIIVDGSLACDMSIPNNGDIDGLIVTDEITAGTEQVIDYIAFSLGFKKSNLRLFSPGRPPPNNSDERVIITAMMIRGEYLQGKFDPDNIAEKCLEYGIDEMVVSILDESSKVFVDEHINKYAPRLEGSIHKGAEF